MNICMFTTNERVHKAAKELGPTANAVINEAVTFSNAVLVVKPFLFIDLFQNR